MPTVFVVQENNRMDYSDAERFGDIRFMTIDEYRPINGSLRNEQILCDIYNHMADFDPNGDWLILTGNPMVMGYTFHLALMRGEGEVNCLQWDRMIGGYRSVRFTSPGPWQPREG